MIVWVTGASSGLGRAIAQALVRRGHTVIGGARSFTGVTQQEGMRCLPLDVTDEASIAAFCKAALALEGHVDALVNAAGVLMLGSCEEMTAQEYAGIMNTDFLGMVRMNQAVLPLMRKAGKGRIVMLSSINGLLGIPFQSAYTAAKHAVEGYAECLMMESRPYGIRTCLVEPGDHRGGAAKYRMRANAMGKASPYEAAFERAVSVIRHDEENGSNPVRLGEKVARALEKRSMPTRLRIASWDQHLAVYLHDLLPAGIFGAILRLYYLRGAANMKK